MNVKELVRELLRTRQAVAAGEVAAAAGLTRQAAHYHLRQMVRDGELRLLGAGRGARYVREAAFSRAYPLDGLEEHGVWEDVVAGMPGVAERDNVGAILRYALTEMVNNAIDHSSGSSVVVSAWRPAAGVALRVIDDGVGAFRHLRDRLGLEDEFAAIQELAKGRITTEPERHTGEGIFFTSKAVDVFVLESGSLRWTVDNLRDDQALGESSAVPGTRVWWQIAADSERDLQGVFGRFRDAELEVSRTRMVLRLFAHGAAFVSRSEAKRLTRGLERFSEVVVDFGRVTDVGRAFADELFRIWAREHPGTRLVPVNMVAAVRMMVERGLPPA